MEADSLAKLVTIREQYLTQLLPLEEINRPVMEEEKAFTIEVEDTWMNLIFYISCKEPFLKIS